MNFKNKNILLFIPNGQGNYGTAVINELKKRGANVVIHDERPSSSTLTKIGFRLAKEKMEYFFLYYLKKIISENRTISFDFVLVIRAEAFTPLSMKLLRNSFPKAKFILYLWDSISNTNTSALFPYFDRTLSFDRKDALKLGLIHRPLFFIDDYRTNADVVDVNIDVLFVGKVHSDRYSFVKGFESVLSENGYTSFFYFYLPSRLVYYQMKMSNPTFKTARFKDFKYNSIPASQAATLLGKSRVSLDAQHPSQTGLTMRTIEVLGAKRKLITTNQDIKSYDFFNSENILVVDRRNPKFDFDFIRSPYVEIPNLIYEKYSLQSWIDDLFDLED
jgi:hypothetical protein